MPWLESHTSLEKHGKLHSFRREMTWSKNEAVGFLHRFWWLVLEVAPDGVISELHASVVADALGLREDVIVSALRAMRKSRLIWERDGVLLVCNWLDYAGTYLKDSRYKRCPEKWEEACRLHGVSSDRRRRTVHGQSGLPTNQTNQPTTGSERTRLRLLEKANGHERIGSG